MLSINLQQRRVLLVDDDVDEALTMLESWLPDILVSDVAMPQNGRHLAARAKELHIPAIAITAHARPEEHQRILASGFDTCLTKPFDPEELCKMIAMRLQTSTE